MTHNEQIHGPQTGAGQGGRPSISIKINDTHYFAPKLPMTGEELKALAGIPKGNRLYRDEHGQRPDTPIPDEVAVEIHPGDHFYDLPPATVGDLPDVDTQIERLRVDYPAVEVHLQADGSRHIAIHDVPIGPGWNKERTRLLIILPPDFPKNRPIGFMADPDLRLADGRQPSGSGAQMVNGTPWLAFCWQPANWDLSRDTLWKYVKLCQRRFVEVHA